LGASQNVVLIKRFVSNLIYNLPKSLQRRDFHIPPIPPKEGFLHITNPSFGGILHITSPSFGGILHITSPSFGGILHITSPSFGGI
jgi:hypothetical protein